MRPTNNEKTNWQEDISDPTERQVFGALANPAWDFRTIAGLAKETKISEDEVRAILNKYPNLVRKSAVPDLGGRELFTLTTRPVSAKETLALVRNFLAKSVY